VATSLRKNRPKGKASTAPRRPGARTRARVSGSASSGCPILAAAKALNEAQGHSEKHEGAADESSAKHEKTEADGVASPAAHSVIGDVEEQGQPGEDQDDAGKPEE
jgi:hypothetical protein